MGFHQVYHFPEDSKLGSPESCVLSAESVLPQGLRRLLWVGVSVLRWILFICVQKKRRSLTGWQWKNLAIWNKQNAAAVVAGEYLSVYCENYGYQRSNIWISAVNNLGRIMLQKFPRSNSVLSTWSLQNNKTSDHPCTKPHSYNFQMSIIIQYAHAGCQTYTPKCQFSKDWWISKHCEQLNNGQILSSCKISIIKFLCILQWWMSVKVHFTYLMQHVKHFNIEINFCKVPWNYKVHFHTKTQKHWMMIT